MALQSFAHPAKAFFAEKASKLNLNLSETEAKNCEVKVTTSPDEFSERTFKTRKENASPHWVGLRLRKMGVPEEEVKTIEDMLANVHSDRKKVFELKDKVAESRFGFLACVRNLRSEAGETAQWSVFGVVVAIDCVIFENEKAARDRSKSLRAQYLRFKWMETLQKDC